MTAIDRIQAAPLRPAAAMISRPLSALHLLLCACAFFGYPLVASISSFVQEKDNFLAISFRAFVLLASLVAIAMHLGASRAGAAGRAFLTIFWLVVGALLFRLIHDVFGLGLEPLIGTDSATFTIWFLGVCIVPAVALFGGASIERFSAAATPTFILAFAVAAATTASSFLGEESLDLTTRAGSLKLNPISYAYVGALLFLLGLTRAIVLLLLYRLVMRSRTR